jgi:RNA polymerase sigma-70 factor (ECF subfamily)
MAELRCGDLTARVDAEDIIQSVFRSFFRRAAAGQYHAPPGQELWQLLVVITLNKTRSTGEYHRAHKRDIHATTGSEELADLTSEREQHQRAFQELRLLVEELLNGLPAAQQRIVQLRLEGHEVAEIAQLTGRSKRTTERVLQDFRCLLQGQLTRGEQG